MRNNIDIKGDSEEDIMNYVNENQLFHSQLESLIVALELVWRIASIKFKDSNKADSAERTGKKRFEKILSYTNNIDLFDTLIESNKCLLSKLKTLDFTDFCPIFWYNDCKDFDKNKSFFLQFSYRF